MSVLPPCSYVHHIHDLRDQKRASDSSVPEPGVRWLQAPCGYFKKTRKVGVVSQAFSSGTLEFKASLVYIVNSGRVRITQSSGPQPS